jgi:hypothetical protein
MALKPSSLGILVDPSPVENNEEETQSGLHVVRRDRANRKVWRGVVRKVGENVHERVDIGDVAHYTDFVAIGRSHIVPEQYLVAIGDESEQE